MKPSEKSPEARVVPWLLAALALIAAVALLLPRHFIGGLAESPPLHAAMEFFPVVVAMLVFTVGINIHRNESVANVVLLSCAFLAVGLFHFGHVLSQDGMPDFVTPNDAGKAIYFSLAAQTVAALTLLAVAVLPWQREAGKRLRVVCLAATLAVAAGAYWLILFHQAALPQVLDAAAGPTLLKRGMEYFLVGINALAAALFYRQAQTPQPYHAGLLFAAAAVAGLSGFFSAAYSEDNDLPSLLAHIYKVIAYYLLYRAVFAYGVRRPYRLLFNSEQRLRENEAVLARVLDGSSDGFWDSDLTTGVVTYRGRWAEMLGYSPEEIAPYRDAWETRVHPDDRERVFKSYADYLAGRIPRYDAEFRMRAKSGEWRWIRSRGKITQRAADGRVLRVSGAHSDITERKMLMEHIARIKHQSELILNAAGEGICGLDTQGRIIFANPAASDMLGYSTMELFGRSLHDTSHHTRPDGSPYPAAECPILASLNSGLTCHEGDEFYYRRDGSRFPVEYTSTPIIDEGNTIGAVVMFNDVTRRHQAEQTLHRWRQFIEHAAWGMAIGDYKSRTITLANPAYARMHGYRAEEIVRMSAWELYAPESRPELPGMHEALEKAGYLSFECERQRKDGSTFPALVDIAIIHDDAQDRAEGNVIVNVQDITQRRQLEAALRESEELFRTLFGGIQDAILVHPISGDGVLGCFVVVNNVACEWLGYSHQEMLGKTPRDIEAPDSGIDTAPVARRVAAGESVTFEQLFVAKDGKRIPVEIRANPFLLKGQKAVIALVRDITERKRAENALRESEERFRSLFGGIQDAIFVHLVEDNCLGHFAVVNDVACERLGYTRQEMLGMTPTDIDAPDIGFDPTPIIKRLAAGESVTFEQVHVAKDGKRIPVELRVNPFSLEGRKAVITVARDITERKEAERALRESEERFRSTFEQAAVGVAHVAPNGAFLRLNQRFCEIAGYSLNELMLLSFQDITHPDDLEKDLGYVQQMLAGEIASYTMEKRYVRKDKTLVWISLTVSLVHKPDGTPDYFIAVIEDITGRKHVEQQLRELSVHLQSVREEEKTSIAREIHDDLGGTLTALKMETYWLARKLPSEKEMVPLLEHVESMSDLLDGAVAVTRRIITELRPTILDDLGLLAALEWQCGQFQKRTGVECRVVCNEDSGCEGELDKAYAINLFRIFQEALTNVSRHADASQVEVEFHHGDDEVVLWISDNGRGLPEGTAAAPDSHGMRGMVERVEQLGGKIKFDSPPGGGLTVTVVLPLPAVGQNAP